MMLKNVTVSADTGVTIYNAKGIRFIDSRVNVAKGPRLITYRAQVEGLDATTTNSDGENH